MRNQSRGEVRKELEEIKAHLFSNTGLKLRITEKEEGEYAFWCSMVWTYEGVGTSTIWVAVTEEGEGWVSFYGSDGQTDEYCPNVIEIGNRLVTQVLRHSGRELLIS